MSSVARPEFFLSATETEQSRVLPGRPESGAVARRLVAATLALWDLPGLVDRATVVVSELATNAVVHAQTNGASIRVSISLVEAGRGPGAVTDLDRRPPVLPDRVPPDSESGRGLALVLALADDCGVHPRHWGKSVWAELAA